MTSTHTTSALAHVRAYDAPVSDLERVRVLRDALDAYEAQTVAEARALGVPWTEISKRVGVTRQTLRKRYGDEDES